MSRAKPASALVSVGVGSPRVEMRPKEYASRAVTTIATIATTMTATRPPLPPRPGRPAAAASVPSVMPASLTLDLAGGIERSGAEGAGLRNVLALPVLLEEGRDALVVDGVD